MKKYQTPEILLIPMQVKDVITASFPAEKDENETEPIY